MISSNKDNSFVMYFLLAFNIWLGGKFLTFVMFGVQGNSPHQILLC